jgi:hypothetical protein
MYGKYRVPKSTKLGAKCPTFTQFVYLRTVTEALNQAKRLRGNGMSGD